MSDFATFTASGGTDARTAIHQELVSLRTVTVGDLLYAGQLFRSRIRERTFRGMDVAGSPFAAYSTKGPYYFYPNRDSGAARGPRATAATQKARKTAASGRYAETGREGKRTPYGIRYDSYAAAKAAHGVSAVNLYGMEQHTHMLDTMMVRAGAAEISPSLGELMAGGEMDAFEGNVACSELSLGFYGPEAERAKGHNEGTSRLPKREFFALSPEDLQLAERALAQRMLIRARAGTGVAPTPNIATRVSGPVTDADIPF